MSVPIRALALIALSFSLPGLAVAAEAPLVFAAASMTSVLEDMARQYATHGAAPPRLAFASSAALARQIEAGAPAELFVSADEEWMDYLQEKNLLRPQTRRDIATNTLVLIAPRDSQVGVELRPGLDLRAALGEGGRLAIGDPASVPAGRYARSALLTLGAWQGVAEHLAPAENVRVALAWVARGEAPLGIVYASDALDTPAVRVVGGFPADSHPRIVYPAAATGSAGRAALAFLDWLGTPEARGILLQHGFLLP